MTEAGEVLAIIPARGGSKRVPRKNLQDFDGRPLLVHSIEDALGAHTVTRVVVSTDDEEIAQVSGDAGAEVVSRPDELAGDTATSESALLHVMDTLRETEGYEPALVVFLQATSPSRAPRDIDGAVQTLLEQRADSLLSVCRFRRYVWLMGEDSAEPLNYDYRRRWREQDFPHQYLENGSIYVFKPQILREQGNRLGGRIALFEMPGESSFQIDEPADFDHRRPW